MSQNLVSYQKITKIQLDYLSLKLHNLKFCYKRLFT